MAISTVDPSPPSDLHHLHSVDQEKRGPDVTIPLEVELEDLFLGKVIEVEMDRQGVCPKCDGSGAENANDVHTCNSCQGRGVKIVRQMIAPGMFQQMQTTCNECGGKGKVIKSKCSHCSGKKVVRTTEILDVSIERGMKDGDVIVLFCLFHRPWFSRHD